MNQRGEITSLLIFILMIFSSLLIYCALKLELNFIHLKKRTNILLCSKIAIQEVIRHVHFISKTNWAIKNAQKIKTVSLLIPGLQGVSLKTENIQIYLKTLQEFEYLRHLENLKKIKHKRCEMTSKTFLTPFKHDLSLYQRDQQQTILQRSSSWEYIFANNPFSIKFILELRDVSQLIINGYFWLNKHYELKTKKHLTQFKSEWNALQAKGDQSNSSH